MKRLMRNPKGFSLIELLIVIAILAVIAAIAVPNLLDNINKSRIRTDVSNAILVANAVSQVLAEDEDYATVTMDSQEFKSGIADNGYIDDVINAAVNSMQSVPTVKYVSGIADGTPTKNFYVKIATGGVVTVHGDSVTSSTDSQLFPTAGGNWVLE